MIRPITFCINTANNEKDYVLLLLKSLKDNTEINMHEILVFVDTDNQNTYEALLDIKKEIPTLRVCKNPKQYPVWCQRNISILFDAAQNELLCYLQSDMVVGSDFDKHICANLKSKDVVLCCARIEPPLHPESPEKIVKSFGSSPDDFQYEEFNKFVLQLQQENRPNIWGHFAPFAIHKSTWIEQLGGFDTQFRSSREDSDMIIRMGLCGLDLVQSWNACVYHFTCVSSRGKDWFTDQKIAQIKNDLQAQADVQELKRFIRKWGFFGHHAKPLYDITFEIELDRHVDLGLLKFIEPYCKQLVLNDLAVVNKLASDIKFEASYYNNLRWGYTYEYWSENEYLFNPINLDERILYEENSKAATGDVVIRAKYSELIDQWSEDIRNIIENINILVHENELGQFSFGPLSISILQKNNLTDSYKRINNLDIILEDKSFTFK
jgi:GT2 family glycosyltransferase